MQEETLLRVDRYIDDLYAAEDEALQRAQESLEKAGMPNYSVSPNQGKLLQVLALACGARNILEIGTLGGYSTIWLARALPPGGRLVSLEVDEKHARVARANLERAGVADRATVRVGDAMENLPRLRDEGAGPFDLIFIDADKPPYARYLDWALRLSHPGTVIVGDNVVMGGSIVDPAAKGDAVSGIRHFNAELAERPGLASVIVQTFGRKGHDGIAIAVVAGSDEGSRVG